MQLRKALGRLLMFDVMRSMDFTIPGIIAHKSAMSGGKWLDVPLFNWFDVMRSMDFTIPGIIAHKSAMSGGKWLDVPLFNW